MMIEGSGSIPLTSGSGSGRPKNMWIRWIRFRIRIRNTALAPFWPYLVLLWGQDGTVSEKTAEYLEAGSGSIFKSIIMLDPDPIWPYLVLLWGEDGSVREKTAEYLEAGSGSIFKSIIMLDPDPIWLYLVLLWGQDGSVREEPSQYLKADEAARGTRTGGVAQQPQHAAAERLRVQQAQQLHHRTHHLVPV
jgi:hypothetical protein